MTQAYRPFIHSLFNHKFLPSLMVLLLMTLAACQGSEETDTSALKQTEETVVDSVRLAARRPAPEFFILNPDIHKNRVFICDDIYSDVFHVQYECAVLAECKATKKNITLGSAVRDNGRYNCETCSPELSHIFDEDLIR